MADMWLLRDIAGECVGVVKAKTWDAALDLGERIYSEYVIVEAERYVQR